MYSCKICNLLFFYLFSLNLYGQFFVDVAASAGVVHSDRSNGPGGGVSFADFNGDGYDDLTFATAAGEPMQFYLNTENGLQALPDPTGNLAEIKHILWVDYDNDGDQDLFCSSFDGPIYLYRRDGDWLFTDVTSTAGLPVITKRHYGAAWGDYNRDGWLDLYYSQRKLPGQVSQSRNRLFKNNGDGTFTESSVSAGAEDANRIPFCLGFTDYNKDRWPDLYIANDRNSRNTLLRNNKDGTFSDVSEESGAGIAIDAMNMGLGDFDRDGDEDIYVTNIEEGSYLLRNDDGVFTNVAPALGVGFYGIGWGASWIDGNLDGWLDLYVSGAIVGSDQISSAYYQNDEGNGFSPPQGIGFVGDTVHSWSNAVGDFNRDNRPDIAVLNQSPYPSQLWRNTGSGGNFFGLRLQGVKSNRDGTGSKVEIYHQGQYQSAYTHCGSGFLAQQSKTIRFGLGEYSLIDSLVVLWPTGHRDVLYAPQANQTYYLIEGSTTGGIIQIDEDVELLLVANEGPLNQQPDYSLFPNPCQTLKGLHINAPISGKAYLYDLQGRLVCEGDVQAGAITLADNLQLPTALYQLHLRLNNGKSIVKKLLLDRQ